MCRRLTFDEFGLPNAETHLGGATHAVMLNGLRRNGWVTQMVNSHRIGKVELRGFEPLTSAVQERHSPN